MARFRERLRSGLRGDALVGAPMPERAWGTGRVIAFDASQGALTVISAGPDPTSDIWPAVALHATAFGDGFTSPLVGGLRARDGLSYDVGWSIHCSGSSVSGSSAAAVTHCS